MRQLQKRTIYSFWKTRNVTTTLNLLYIWTSELIVEKNEEPWLLKNVEGSRIRPCTKMMSEVHCWRCPRYKVVGFPACKQAMIMLKSPKTLINLPGSSVCSQSMTNRMSFCFKNRCSHVILDIKWHLGCRLESYWFYLSLSRGRIGLIQLLLHMEMKATEDEAHPQIQISLWLCSRVGRAWMLSSALLVQSVQCLANNYSPEKLYRRQWLFSPPPLLLLLYLYKIK